VSAEEVVVDASLAVKDLRPYFRGWTEYFGWCETPWMLSDLDKWGPPPYRSYLTLGYGAAAQRPLSCVDYSILLGPGGYHGFTVEPGNILAPAILRTRQTSNYMPSRGATTMCARG
jgi:Group II intron, maturase-specific domain